MTLEAYKPVRQKYAEWATHYSPVTDKLLKRKRILLFTGATAQEWVDLANDFLANNGRANHKFCMTEYKKAGGEIETPEPELQQIHEPEFPQLPDEIYDWQEYAGD